MRPYTLTTQKTIKMRKNHTTTNHTNAPTPQRAQEHPRGLMLATTIHKSNTTPHHQVRRQQPPPTPGTPQKRKTTDDEGPTLPLPGIRARAPLSLLPQDPTVCLAAPRDKSPSPVKSVCRAPEPDPLQIRAHPTNRPKSRLSHTMWAGFESRGAP